MCLPSDDELALEPDAISAAHMRTLGGLLTVPEQQIATSIVPVVERLLQVHIRLQSHVDVHCNAWQHDQTQAALMNVGSCW